MSGDRRAALALHAMAPADRDWMLGQLAPDERALLAPLLDELRSLGIAAEPGLDLGVPAAAAEPQMTVVPAAPAVVETTPPAEVPLPSPIERVRGASAARVAAVLADEPARLLACVLAVDRFDWADALLQQLPTERRRAVRECMPPAVAPRLAEALVGELDARLAVAVESPQTAPRRVRFSTSLLPAWIRSKVPAWN
jgi:hypothetical protein